MKFIELWRVLDDIHPLWINENGESTYFENRGAAGMSLGVEYASRIVKYITLDGDGVLTIELERRKER